MTFLIWTGISLVFTFWLVVLYSCIKVASREERITETLLLGEEEHCGDQSETIQVKEAR